MKTAKLFLKKVLFILTFALFLNFGTGCSEDILKAKDETVEAVDNLKNEATEIKEDVEVKIDQVNEAKESIENAADSIYKAAEDMKTVID